MNAIPLVNNNSVNDINTSLIAIKKNLNNQGQLQDVDVNVGINIATNCTYCAASSTTIKGAQLYNGCSIKVLFTSAITGSDTTTPMSINYNDVSIPVKTGKNGVLSNFVANNIGGSYIYCQAYTTLELLFDGSQFIIMGNPVVISSADYTIYTDGTIAYTTTGITNVLQSKIWNEVKDLGRFGNSNYHLYEARIVYNANLSSTSGKVGKLSDYIQLKSDARVVEWNPCFETRSGNTFGYIISDSLLACYVINSDLIYASQQVSSGTVKGMLKISFKYISEP